MRKVILILVSFVLTLSLVNLAFAQEYQDWKWKHQTPQGNALRWVKMWDANNWYAVGYVGTFMKTSNAGANWYFHHKGGFPLATGATDYLYCGYFFNQNTGFVAGSTGILKTTNAGVTFDTVMGISTSGTIYNMFFMNNNTGFVAGTSSIKVYYTTNAGVNWAQYPGLGSVTCYDVYASDLNNVVVSSSSGNIYKTTNGGTNWATISTGASNTLYAMRFVNANTGCVTGSSGTFRFTTNGGLNWTTANTPSTSSMYNLFLETGVGPVTKLNEGFESTTFPPAGWLSQNVTGTEVWQRSIDAFHTGAASAFINYNYPNGEDWLKSPQVSIASGDSLVFWIRKYLSSNYPPDSMIVRVSTTDTTTAAFSNVIWKIEVNSLTTSFQRFAVSLNSFAGQTIRIAFQHKDSDGNGAYLDDVVVSGTANILQSAYTVGDAFYIHRTTNLGTNWTQIDHLDPAQPWTSTFYAMDKIGNNMVAVGSSGLFNRSTNGGTNWTTFTMWKSAGTFYDVWSEYNDGKVWVVGSPGSSGSTFDQILYSSNGGTTWTNQTIGSTRYFRSICMLNSTTGYIAGSSGAVYKTTNGGTSWDSLPFPSTSLLYKVDFVNASTGWAFGSSSPYVWKTVDGGLNWASQTGPSSTVYNGDMIDANTGWMVGSSGSVRYTTNGGTNWNTQTPNFSSTLYGIKMLSATTGYICGSSGTVRKTTNAGTNWDTVLTPYSTTLYSTSWYNVNNGFIVGSSGYAAKTSNGGQSWTIMNTGGSTMYGVYQRHTDSAWTVGSLAYVFKMSKAPVGNITWNNELPTTYTLSQNYPNPFNPSTTIKFGIPKAGKVTLNIYDVTGRLVSTLFNNAPLNAGTVTYKFDGSNLASGVYFYTLIVDDNKIDTKKMVLVK